MAKRMVLIGLVLALAVSLCACGGDGSGVSVQRADQLMAAGQAGDRYAGMVVSENVVQIQRDSTKTVEEVYVEVGQEVQAGDKLFSYDSDALELELEKTQLEVEKMTNEQTTYSEQLEKLEKQLSRTYNESSKVKLTLEINTLKTTQMENDYNIAAKNQEITKLQEMLENIDITTPVDGTVRQIDETGESGAYITVQQSGAYRIQGSINEMSVGNGLMEGTRVKIYSRVSDETWMGTVTLIDTANPEQNNSDYYYYGYSDEMTSTTSYPFYVELDSVEGLLLGQHVYMEVTAGETTMPGLWIPESYLAELGWDEETGETTGSIWVANSRGKLEQRSITLGMYDGMTGCYEVLSGLSAEEYVADPMAPGCESGASVTYRESDDFTGGAVTTDPAGEPEEGSDELDIFEEMDEPIGEEGEDMVVVDGAVDETLGETTGETEG